jgi:hypothetical protein
MYSSSPPARFVRPRGRKTTFSEHLHRLTGPAYATKETGCRRLRNEKYIRLAKVIDRVKVPLHLVDAYREGRCRLKVSARHGARTLLYLDFDTHTTGSTEDVRLLAQAVRQHFPHMPEFVIDERGGSGWLVVNTAGTSPEQYNRLVRRLQNYLCSVAESMGLDIEHVEVKGKVYEPTYLRGRVTAVKAGDLLKCPPSLDWLTQPAIPAGRLSTAEFEPWQPVTPQAVARTGELKVQQSGGSFRARLVSDETAARLPELAAFVERAFPDRPVKVGRWAITARQFAEVLLALVVLKPNSDGTNPAARHAAFITELHSEGVFESGHVHHRYKAVRDYLSGKGCIHWGDSTYRPGQQVADGRTKRKDGMACKWSLDPVLVQQVEDVLKDGNTQQVTLFDTHVEQQRYTGRHRVPTAVWAAEIVPSELLNDAKRVYERMLLHQLAV